MKAKICACSQPCGGFQIRKKATATGRAAAYMKGWRRPSLERKLSEIWPTIGSTKASKMSATIRAVDTICGGRPIT